MHSTLRDYDTLPLYTILYEKVSGEIGMLHGTLKYVFILVMQDHDKITSSKLDSTVFLKGNEAVAFGYYNIIQYLDDEVQEMINNGQC